MRRDDEYLFVFQRDDGSSWAVKARSAETAMKHISIMLDSTILSEFGFDEAGLRQIEEGRIPIGCGLSARPPTASEQAAWDGMMAMVAPTSECVPAVVQLDELLEARHPFAWAARPSRQ